MGISEKLHQMDGGDVNSENWVFSGITLRSPLKPVFTKPPPEKNNDAEDQECCSTTPTFAESRIVPARLVCPPAPKKRKPTPARSCHYGGVREFFNPPELETIFIRRVEGK